jgi:hypothetical protein
VTRCSGGDLELDPDWPACSTANTSRKGTTTRIIGLEGGHVARETLALEGGHVARKTLTHQSIDRR